MSEILDEDLQAYMDNVFLVLDNQLFPLNKLVITIGRHSSNDLIIKEPGLSRYHARVVFEAGRFILEDLDSRNGTFINNEKTNRTELHSGDNISFANTPILFINRSTGILRQLEDDTGKL